MRLLQELRTVRGWIGLIVAMIGVACVVKQIPNWTLFSWETLWVGIGMVLYRISERISDGEI